MCMKDLFERGFKTEMPFEELDSYDEPVSSVLERTGEGRKEMFKDMVFYSTPPSKPNVFFELMNEGVKAMTISAKITELLEITKKIIKEN